MILKKTGSHFRGENPYGLIGLIKTSICTYYQNTDISLVRKYTFLEKDKIVGNSMIELNNSYYL